MKDSTRKTELAKIHLAKKDLAMTDDSYRALMLRVTGKESAAALSATERSKLIAEFVRLGWQPKRRKAASGDDWRTPRIRLIWRLWHWLADHAVVRSRSSTSLLAFCAQHMQATRLEWAESEELNKIVEALKDWQRRTQRAKQHHDPA